MFFLGPVWSTEPSSASSGWDTRPWRFDRSAGSVDDFLLLSTGEITEKQINERVCVRVCVCVYNSCKLLTERLKNNKAFLTDWAEDFIRAVCAVLLPITGKGDVNTAAVITLELVL